MMAVDTTTETVRTSARLLKKSLLSRQKLSLWTKKEIWLLIYL